MFNVIISLEVESFIDRWWHSLAFFQVLTSCNNASQKITSPWRSPGADEESQTLSSMHIPGHAVEKHRAEAAVATVVSKVSLLWPPGHCPGPPVSCPLLCWVLSWPSSLIPSCECSEHQSLRQAAPSYTHISSCAACFSQSCSLGTSSATEPLTQRSFLALTENTVSSVLMRIPVVLRYFCARIFTSYEDPSHRASGLSHDSVTSSWSSPSTMTWFPTKVIFGELRHIMLDEECFSCTSIPVILIHPSFSSPRWSCQCSSSRSHRPQAVLWGPICSSCWCL